MFGSEQKIKKSNLTAVQVLYIQKLCVRMFERLKPLVKVSLTIAAVQKNKMKFIKRLEKSMGKTVSKGVVKQ